MTQQNLYPRKAHNGKQPQPAVNTTRLNHAPKGTSSQTVTPQNRPAQFRQASQQYPQEKHQNTTTRHFVRASSQPNGRVRLFGRVGRYFDMRQTQTGKSLATFSLATQKPYLDEAGNKKTQTVWQRVVAWGNTAESLSELLQKGARVSVDGKFKTREWTDNEDNLQTTTELVAQNVRFLDVAGQEMAAAA